VLLLVPALLAIGHDVRRLFTSLSRALTQPQGGIGQFPRVAALGVMGWLAVTLGWTIWSGALPSLLSGLSGWGDPLRTALVLAIGGAAGLLAVVWVAGAVAVLLAERRAQRVSEQP